MGMLVKRLGTHELIVVSHYKAPNDSYYVAMLYNVGIVEVGQGWDPDLHDIARRNGLKDAEKLPVETMREPE